MGADRIEHQKQSPAEVSLKLHEEFGVAYKEIYDVWEQYNARRALGYDATHAIESMKKIARVNGEKIYNYFIAMAMEMINADIIQGGKK